MFLLYQAEERKGKREETTVRRMELLDIVTGREAGEKEQMAKHGMTVINASKAGLPGRVSRTTNVKVRALLTLSSRVRIASNHRDCPVATSQPQQLLKLLLPNTPVGTGGT